MTRKDPEPENAPVRRELRAMNSDIELACYAIDASHRLDRAEGWLRAFEARYSRFSFFSELSRLNRAAGRPFQVSKGLLRLVALALELAKRSDGVFDPTVLRALESAGYDRSFELLDGSRRASTPSLASSSPSPVLSHAEGTERGNEGVRSSSQAATGRSISYQDVVLDPAARTILLPEGTGIDLGGIGKGFAVDRLVAILGSPCLVNGGGDVFVAGRPHDARAWRVGIEDPFAPERDLRVLALRDRAVATSTTLRRRWRTGSQTTAHHLIDTRTGASSETDALQVSIVAPTTTLADYHAKVALLLGVEAGLRYVNNEPGIEGLVVGRDGSAHESSGLATYVLETAT